MLLRTGRGRSEQMIQPLVRIDPAEVGSVVAQLAKKWTLVGSHTLTNNGDPDAPHGQGLRGHCRENTASIRGCRVSKSVHLVRAPEVC